MEPTACVLIGVFQALEARLHHDDEISRAQHVGDDQAYQDPFPQARARFRSILVHVAGVALLYWGILALNVHFIRHRFAFQD